MTIVKENSPHLRRKADVTRMMLDVLIALAPTLIFSFVVYPINTLIFYAISLSIMILSEFIYVGLRNMPPKDGTKRTFKEWFQYAYKDHHFNRNNVISASITATIFTLVMPAGAPIYAVIIGALVGIVFGKLVFGGLGSNIFNPAVVGMLFAKLCFGNQYVKYVDTWFYAAPDAMAGPTFLSGGLASTLDNFVYNMDYYSLGDLFLGRIPGTLGEVYKITILVGMVYLLIRRSADYRIILSYLGTFTFFSLIVGLSVFGKNNAVNPWMFTLYSVFSGGVLFGAVFMLTDPVTSPINSPSRVMFGMIAAISTVFIRFLAALPEGVGFSILIANMIACVLDHYEWSSPRYTVKKIIGMVCLVVIPALILFLCIYLGGVYNG